MDPIDGSPEESGEAWLKYLRQKRAFASGGVLGASVGNFSEQQLLNPLGSRVTVHVYRVGVGAAVGTRIELRSYDTALGTLVTTSANLWIGGPAPVAQHCTAQPAGANGTLITALQRPLNSDSWRYADWVAILEPGKGILFVPDAVNQELGVEFFWAELPH
jgi:hypothetical protein